MEIEILNVLLGSGISGVALFMFYKLMQTEIRDLKRSIDRLADKLG